MSSSVKTLREIFLNPDYSLRRRIKAASAILTFESPAEVIEETKAFLTQVFENPELHIDLRLDALEVMRKAEAPRVVKRTVSSADQHAEREMARDILKAKRRLAIYKAGLWPLPPGVYDDLDAEGFDPVAAL